MTATTAEAPEPELTESELLAKIIRSWPVLPEHTADDGSPCLWAGVGSESGKCPDRCASLSA